MMSRISTGRLKKYVFSIGILCLSFSIVNILSFARNNYNIMLPDVPFALEHVEQKKPVRRTLHVIHCLSGNDPSFIEEWEIGMKSVLVNAPLDSNLHIHLIADNNAAKEIDSIASKNKWAESVWRNEIEVIVHNVEDMVPSWKEFLTNKLTNESNRGWMDKRVGIGGYFRLLAHRVIVQYECKNSGTSCPDVVKRDLQDAVYMDVDAIIIANLNHLRDTSDKILRKAKEEGRQSPLWIWHGNSGFIVLDLTRMEEMWEMVVKTPIKDKGPKAKGDQSILSMVEQHYVNVTAIMPFTWSTHTGHDGFRAEPQQLIKTRNEVGMLHFTMPKDFGNNFMDRGGTDKWCIRSPRCNHKDIAPGGDMHNVRSSWGLAEYYSKLNWEWALFQGGTSRLRPGEDGHALKYVNKVYLLE
jgi:lipopolysaccharide biosynthesis glycosyltransferase